MRLRDFLERFEPERKFVFNYWIVDRFQTSYCKDYSYDDTVIGFLNRCSDDKYSFLLDVVLDFSCFRVHDDILYVDYSVIV